MSIRMHPVRTNMDASPRMKTEKVLSQDFRSAHTGLRKLHRQQVTARTIPSIQIFLLHSLYTHHKLHCPHNVLHSIFYVHLPVSGLKFYFFFNIALARSRFIVFASSCKYFKFKIPFGWVIGSLFIILFLL